MKNEEKLNDMELEGVVGGTYGQSMTVFLKKAKKAECKDNMFLKMDNSSIPPVSDDDHFSALKELEEEFGLL